MATTIVYLAPDCELVVVLNETLLCASGSGYYSFDSGSSRRKESSWFDDFNPTKDYYGMHGEFDSNDEIGELCDAINTMAGELNQAEKAKNDFISSRLRTRNLRCFRQTVLSGVSGGEDHGDHL